MVNNSREIKQITSQNSGRRPKHDSSNNKRRKVRIIYQRFTALIAAANDSKKIVEFEFYWRGSKLTLSSGGARGFLSLLDKREKTKSHYHPQRENNVQLDHLRRSREISENEILEMKCWLAGQHTTGRAGPR
jgi:hypothetical protein